MSSFISLFDSSFPYSFTLTFTLNNGAVQVEDYDSTYFLQPAIDQQTAIAQMSSFFFQPDPKILFETAWLPGTGQQRQEVLMPIYDQRYLSGDISNMPYFSLQQFVNIHFAPNGDGVFQGPSVFDILEGPSDFELRTPE